MCPTSPLMVRYLSITTEWRLIKNYICKGGGKIAALANYLVAGTRLWSGEHKGCGSLLQKKNGYD